MKYGSSIRVWTVLARTSPNVSLRAADSCRAARLGTHSSSAATFRTRARVASETPGWLFSAYDTAPWETPQRLAISLMVTRATTASFTSGRTADGRSGILQCAPISTLCLQSGAERDRLIKSPEIGRGQVTAQWLGGGWCGWGRVG
jgi:hypothetical protein